MDKDYLDMLRKRIPAPDILGRERYTPTAILVPLVFVDGKEHLLFERRASHIKQGNEICFPGGHFDPECDTTYLETAIRETREELGVSHTTIELIGQLDTLVSPRGLIVECYLAALDIDDLSGLTLDTREVAEVFTVPVDWFIANPPEEYRMRVEIQSTYINSNGEKEVLLPVEKLGLPEKYKENRSEWMHRVYVYHHEHAVIWGLTAAVVQNLIRKLFFQ